MNAALNANIVIAYIVAYYSIIECQSLINCLHTLILAKNCTVTTNKH